MSAFIVSQNLIDYLMHAAFHYKTTWTYRGRRQAVACEFGSWHENAKEIGRKLWFANLRSVRELYKNSSETVRQQVAPSDFPAKVRAYAIKKTYDKADLDPLQVLKSVHCFEYQACDHPKWKSSEAREFCQQLKDDAILALEGYDDREWGPPP